ncbi:MAG: tetratricopeptide repeat protein [Alphaproteobacteria bacterium]|nr:tetratricopeptide repeat protein [Pseudomonadota bacterium]
MLRRAGLTVLLLLAFAAPTVAGDDAAYEAYHKGDYAEAYRLWIPLAEAGDPSAQYNIAVMHHHGLGVERVLSRAVRWYARAAENGNAKAQTVIGDFYVDGYWEGEDYAAAASWYALAAEQGNAEAQRKLGILYVQDFGVTPDRAQAVRWLRRSHAQGDEEATTWLRALGESVEELAEELVFLDPSTTGRPCQGLNDPAYDVHVRIEIPEVPVNHGLSIAELGQRSFHGPGQRVLGVAESNLEIKTEARHSTAPSGDVYCFWVDAVDVTLRYDTLQIFVAREYDSRSCAYREILQHEEDHIRVSREVLEYYAPLVRSALSSLTIPKARDPAQIDSPAEGERKMEELFDKVLEPVYSEIIDVLERRQAELDAPREYDRIHRRCSNW